MNYYIIKQLKESGVANCMELNGVFQWFKMEIKIRCILKNAFHACF